MTQFKEQLTIAVVGDIHNQWEQEDELALLHLGVDLVLFVGDFGNEAVGVVSKIAKVNIPKAVIMGNHDAWYSASSWGKQKAPYDQSKEDRVQQQLDLLGSSHVGFSKLDFPQFNLSVVGSRPFSWGGSTWRNRQFYSDRYNVKNFEESTNKIVAAAQAATQQIVILIGHNGPFGLGSKPGAICGRDWKSEGGDYGDPDLQAAIAEIQSLGKSIPMVTFGHMHHILKHPYGERRTMVNAQGNTIYLNAACVPRIIQKSGDVRRSFSLVSLEKGQVANISLIWLDKNFIVQSNETLYQVEGQKV